MFYSKFTKKIECVIKHISNIFPKIILGFTILLLYSSEVKSQLDSVFLFDPSKFTIADYTPNYYNNYTSGMRYTLKNGNIHSYRLTDTFMGEKSAI